jgi:hypothetical protein
VLAIGLIVLLAIVIGFVAGTIYRALTGTAGGSPSPGATLATSTSPGSSPSGSATPPSSGSSAPSAAPSAGATPVVAAPEGLIPPGSAASVLVDGLRMREAPSTSALLVEDLPVGRLLALGYSRNRGDWGPVSADGFAWYPVISIGELTELPPLSDGPILLEPENFGWVAAGDATEDFIQLLDVRCPAGSVDLPTLEAMLPWEQLSCFGDRQLTVEGTYGCGECGFFLPGTYEPGWLAGPFSHAWLTVDSSTRLGPFSVRIPPDSPPEPEQGTIVQVTGHFDDPAAVGCTVAPGEPPVPVDAAAAELYCSEQFVVESMEVIGTDPEFPFP